MFKYLPLNSDPDIMTSFLKDIGVRECFTVADIMSLDEDSVERVPWPSLGVMLFLPITQNYLETVYQIENIGHDVETVMPGRVIEPYFIKLANRKAATTVALLHTLVNNAERVIVTPKSDLENYLEATLDLSPQDRGQLLQQHIDNRNTLAGVVDKDEEIVDPNDIVMHCIAFINYKNHIIEFDGCRKKPIVYVAVNDQTFLKEAFKIARKYVSLYPFSLKYSAASFSLVDSQ